MFTKVFFGIFFSTLYAIFNVTGAAIIKAKLKNSTLINFNDWLSFLFSGSLSTFFSVSVLACQLVSHQLLSSGSFLDIDSQQIMTRIID